MKKTDEKIDELLKVLDLTKREQIDWLHYDQCLLNREEWREAVDNDTLRGRHLADLAFRLRDEVDPKVFGVAMAQVCRKDTLPVENPEMATTMLLGFTLTAKPIHWIISALIAKVLADERP